MNSVMSDIQDSYDNMTRLIGEIEEKDVGEFIPVERGSDMESDQGIQRVLELFEVLGVLEFRESHGSWELRFNELRQVYFAKSLLKYMENDLTVFHSWEEGRKNVITSANIFYGTQFLHYLEKNREKALPDPDPLRERSVVKAIIKADFNYRKKPLYLFEYHRKPEQYKLIGGLVEDHDSDLREALEREIDEETPRLNLDQGDDYYLKHLKEYDQKVISYTYGAYSEYAVHYYLVDFIDGIEFDLSGQNEWLTIDEIKKGRSKEGDEIFPLEEEVIELMERQPPSINVPAPFDPMVFIKSYWRELIAIVTLISFMIGLLRLIMVL